MPGPTREELVEFVYHEARLIDEKRFDEWFDLFTEDARYWIPLAPGQQDAALHTSLMYEDKLLLKLRIERLRNPRSYSQLPESRCLHVLQRPQIEDSDPEKHEYRVRTPFLYTETRADEQQMYAATAFHALVVEDGRVRIRQKRVNILNCDAALPSVQLFL